MNKKLAVIAIAVLIGACTDKNVQNKSDAVSDQKPSEAMSDHSPSMQMHKAMMSMGKMEMTGDVDRDFAIMMADHHMGAIKMVDIYLQHGKNAPLVAMAKGMKAAQTKERAELLKHAQMKQ
ncbi:MAG: DUF305 domain-containing protein [Armatimonadetes bacterium]|nr:DUF305 domain-containing protein [Armatimonadota bacterium]